MSDLFTVSGRAGHDGTRRVVVAGAVIGCWMGVTGRPAEAGVLIDGLVEARRQPRGYFLRLRRAGVWPDRQQYRAAKPGTR